MDKIDFQTVTAVFNLGLLVMQLYITAKISELKVYMHEKFVMKGNNA